MTLEKIQLLVSWLFSKAFRKGYKLGRQGAPRSHTNFSLMGYSASREAERGYSLGMSQFRSTEEKIND